jgi:hypothetical protein
MNSTTLPMAAKGSSDDDDDDFTPNDHTTIDGALVVPRRSKSGFIMFSSKRHKEIRQELVERGQDKVRKGKPLAFAGTRVWGMM